MKKIVLLFVLFISIISISFAHSGRTDSNGGHYNRSTGEYHYHHGHSAHQHNADGSCSYETNQEDGDKQENSSFSEYYKKWKEENGITEEQPYREVSDEEKIRTANDYIDKNFKEINKDNMKDIIKNKNEQIEKLSNKIEKKDKKYIIIITLINCIYIMAFVSYICFYKFRNKYRKK